MTDDDRIELAVVLNTTAELYGKAPFPPDSPALKLFIAALSPYTLADIKRALGTHIRNSPFMPRPADIARFIEGGVDDKAAAAWWRVLTAIRTHAYYDSVKFTGKDGPAIHFAIERMGGWVHICERMTNDNETFMARNFERNFSMALLGGCQWANVPCVLKGWHALNNEGTGHETKVYEIGEGISDDRRATLKGGNELSAISDGTTRGGGQEERRGEGN